MDTNKPANSLSIEYLMDQTRQFKNMFHDNYIPDRKDPEIPVSVFKYEPYVWEESPGLWHTLLGRLPDEGIWAMGTSPVESLIEFNRELQATLQPDGMFIPLSEPARQQLHKDVFQKIDKIMGWTK